ncbi:MAG: YitT family protein [Oscillospiraceae bacterium]|nr:YitT family protein [Clostridiaceae bacterium]MDY5947682.1 YitT family protein [Oscillospiraceae bacterium]
MRKTKVSDILKNNGMWIIGCILYSIGVNSFAVPNSIAQSGVTGVAVILNHLFSVPVGTVNLLLNIPLLILMWIFLGKKLVARTLWVTVLLSAALDLIAMFIPVYTGDKILASLFCGLLQGSGLGLIMITGATSGGTDIVARLVHKFFPHITIGRVVMLADAVIIAAGMLVFGSIETGLYAIIVIFVSTKVIDSMIYGTGNGKMLMVVTDKADEVSKAIISSSRRGVSIIPAVGAYTGESKNVLICVARKHEISGIIKTIKSIDDKTFIIVSEANEILGEGFNHAI